MAEASVIIYLRDGERRTEVIIWLGKYRIESMLGEAHSGGDVFLAEHVRLQTKRVIKRIRRNHPFYRQLAGEAEVLGRLDHPGIPRLHDVEEDDQYLYFIEEFVEGISLKDLVLSDRLKEDLIITIALQICRIIQYLHEQEPPVYYLDLKPEHLILSEGEVRLIDFGSAVSPAGEDGIVEHCDLQLGTEGYAPPELYDGTAGSRSDVYGIGSVLYFLMTGSISPDAVADRNAGRYPYTRKLWSIVRRCRQREAERRPALEELIDALNRLDRNRTGKQFMARRKVGRGILTGLFCGEPVSQGKRVIGLIGTHPGAGVTHISLLLSFHLAENTGKPVAYLEYNHHGDCARFLEQRETGRRPGGFRCEPDCYPEVTPEGLTQLLNEDYAFYVIDFGCETEENLSEFLRCGEKIVVTQLTEWKLEEIEQFRCQLKEIFRQEEWHWIYNLSEESRKRGNPKGVCFPWEADVCRPSPRADRIFAELLSGGRGLPTGKKRK